MIISNLSFKMHYKNFQSVQIVIVFCSSLNFFIAFWIDINRFVMNLIIIWLTWNATWWSTTPITIQPKSVNTINRKNQSISHTKYRSHNYDRPYWEDSNPHIASWNSDSPLNCKNYFCINNTLILWSCTKTLSVTTQIVT